MCVGARSYNCGCVKHVRLDSNCTKGRECGEKVQLVPAPGNCSKCDDGSDGAAPSIMEEVKKIFPNFEENYKNAIKAVEEEIKKKQIDDMMKAQAVRGAEQKAVKDAEQGAEREVETSAVQQDVEEEPPSEENSRSASDQSSTHQDEDGNDRTAAAEVPDAATLSNEAASTSEKGDTSSSTQISGSGDGTATPEVQVSHAKSTSVTEKQRAIVASDPKADEPDKKGHQGPGATHKKKLKPREKELLKQSKSKNSGL